MKRKITKAIILIAAYALLMIVELFFYVPYERIEVFISKQNVPHTEIIGNGYASLSYIDGYPSKEKTSIEAKRVDVPRLLTSVTATTLVAAAIFFLFIINDERPHKGDLLNDAINTAETAMQASQRQGAQLRQVMQEFADVKAQNVQLQNTIEILRKQTLQLQNTIDEICMQDTENALNEELTLPMIDINGLAFADEAEIKAAQAKYAEDMYEYIKYRITKEI